MKILGIGDIHGRDTWKDILDQDFDLAVFVGDYFDSFDITAVEQIFNFEEIIRAKQQASDKIKLLIGNHDFHYFPEIGNNGTKGYQFGAAMNISSTVNEYREHLQMAFSYDKLLFTHAGVSEVWLNDVFASEGWGDPIPNSTDEVEYILNDIWKYKPKYYHFNGNNMYGDDVEQTPIWIRPRSLKCGSKNLKKNGITQIVGHTSQTSIDMRSKWYLFIDALQAGEYLIIEDDKFLKGKV